MVIQKILRQFTLHPHCCDNFQIKVLSAEILFPHSKISHIFAELNQLTGLAALLRFPMPDIEGDDSSDSDDDWSKN